MRRTSMCDVSHTCSFQCANVKSYTQKPNGVEFLNFREAIGAYVLCHCVFFSSYPFLTHRWRTRLFSSEEDIQFNFYSILNVSLVRIVVNGDTTHTTRPNFAIIIFVFDPWIMSSMGSPLTSVLTVDTYTDQLWITLTNYFEFLCKFGCIFYLLLTHRISTLSCIFFIYCVAYIPSHLTLFRELQSSINIAKSTYTQETFAHRLSPIAYQQRHNICWWRKTNLC